MKNVLKLTAFSAFLVIGVAFTAPQKAEALLLDPLFEHVDVPGPHCLFMDCDDRNSSYEPDVYNVNSNNVNSFNTNTQYNNTGAGTQNIGTTGTTQSSTQPLQSATNSNYNYNYNVNTPAQTYVPVVQPVPVYQPAPVYHYPSYPTYHTPPLQGTLSVSCSANTTYTTTGSYVTWNAYPSGGYSNYSYRWSGTDNLYGTGSSVTTYYHTPGNKYAYVTVYDGYGRTASAQCSNSVNVTGTTHYYQQPVYYNQPISYAPQLQVACAADTTSTRTNIPVTWTAEAYLSGYSGGFTYSWSGSEGLYGSQSSAVIKYGSTGKKTATVTVVAPNGESMTKTCSNSVTVKGATVATGKNVVPKITPVAAATPAPQVVYMPPPPEYSAASLFSLGNVPWGWVGILIILMLIGIIFYLAFNKKKI
jgi:hypothetical protein